MRASETSSSASTQSLRYASRSRTSDAVEERRAAVDDVRQRRLAQRLLDGPGLRVEAVEDREVGPAAAPRARIRGDLLDDEAGLVLLARGAPTTRTGSPSPARGEELLRLAAPRSSRSRRSRRRGCAPSSGSSARAGPPSRPGSAARSAGCSAPPRRASRRWPGRRRRPRRRSGLAPARSFRSSSWREVRVLVLVDEEVAEPAGSLLRSASSFPRSATGRRDEVVEVHRALRRGARARSGGRPRRDEVVVVALPRRAQR